MKANKMHFCDQHGPICGVLGLGVSDITLIKTQVDCAKCLQKLSAWSVALNEFHEFVRETQDNNTALRGRNRDGGV